MNQYMPVGFSEEIFRQRYAFTDEETFDEACARVSRVVSSCELPEKRTKIYEKFYEELSTNRFMPAGRIWYGAGKPKSNLINCFVIDTGDSREMWGETLKNALIILGVGGGLGINFSSIRPRGSSINGTGGTASGSISLMKMINVVANEIKSGGNRRSALLFALDINHGDIEEFLNSKLNRNELTNANISVAFDKMSPKEFFDKVKDGSDIEFFWRQEKIRKSNAKKLWETIINNSFECGEPGILNLNLANQMNNIYYYKNLVSFNPCGEVPLSANNVCVLGSLVLHRFINEDKCINWDLLDETIRMAVRFLDNVVGVTSYPLKAIEEESSKIRRIGLGITGLHDVLIRMGLDYCSEKSLRVVDELFNFIKNRSYEASTYLAAEKGTFHVYDQDLIMKSGFIKRLKPSVKNRIKQYGLRNCALNSIAPTGTISIVSGNCSSGIEPSFGPAWIRRYRTDFDKFKDEIVFNPLFAEAMKNNEKIVIDNFHSIEIEGHLKMQAICQNHIDQSISKTIIMQRDKTSKEQLSDLLMEYIPKLKGVTVYPLDSRDGQPITPISTEEAISRWNDMSDNVGGSSTSVDSCKNGKCDL